MRIAARYLIKVSMLAMVGLYAFSGTSTLAVDYAGAPPPPRFEAIDSVGVDLLGQTWLARDIPSISTAGMSYQPSGFGNRDNLIGTLQDGIASFLGQSIDVNKLNGRQASLSCTSAEADVGTCTLLLGDGTTATYDKTKRSNIGTLAMANGGVMTQLVKPDGEVLTYTYNNIPPFMAGSTMLYGQTLRSVQSSLGWMMQYSSGKIINLSVNYCDPLSTTACIGVTPSITGGSVSLPSNGIEYIDALGNSTKIYLYVSWTGPTNYFYAMRGITYPSGRTKTLLLDSSDGYKVSKMTIGSSVWNYVNPRPAGGVDDRTTVTDPLGNTQVLIHESTYLGSRRVLSYQDQLGRITKYNYVNDTKGPTRVITPGATYSGSALTGGYTDYVYDNRNNITSVSVVPAGGGAPLVTLANYPATCTAPNEPKSCNKPTWVRDPKGNQTDYIYDTTGSHGGVLVATGPVDANGIRSQKRYSYSALYAKIKNSSGALINAATPVWRLISMSECQTATSGNPASCVGTVDEVVTTYEYNTSNLLLTAVTTRAGNANPAVAYSGTNLWQTISYGYDDVGNQLWVDGPLPGADDRSYTTYDVLRRKIFEIAPDPDGGGTLKRKIVKHNYDVDGREYLTQVGTGNATDGSDFVVNSFTRNSYDSVTGLLVKTEVGQP